MSSDRNSKIINRFYKTLFVFLCLFLSLFCFSSALASTISSSNNTGLSDGLVGYWTFDGKDTHWTSAVTGTTNDLSGQGNIGTLTNMSRVSTPIIGIMGQGLKFDGVDDHVNAGTQTSLDITGAFTVSVWVKSTKNNAALFQGVVGKANYNGDELGYFLTKRTDNKYYFQVSLGGYTRNELTTYSNNAYVDNEWHHLVGVLLADGTHYLYVDGIQQTAHSGTGTFRPATSARPLVIGTAYSDFYTVVNEKFGGSIDDVRIYNRALSATEVSRIYNASVSSKINTTQTPKDILSLGLVGYWTFDGKDNHWTSATAGTATDLSGQGNTGTLTNMSRSLTPVVGKTGQALKLDGVNDYVDLGNISSLNFGMSNFSIGFWIKTSTNNDGAVYTKKTGGYSSVGAGVEIIKDSAVGLRLSLSDGVNGSAFWLDRNSVATNEWIYVVVVVDRVNNIAYRYKDGVRGSNVDISTITGLVNTSEFAKIGTSNDAWGAFDGSIDDVRIYDRALSATEVSRIYNSSASSKMNMTQAPKDTLSSGLVGYWSFDGKDTHWTSATAGTVTDLSGQGNTATLTNMSRAVTPVMGKIGQALKFDGVNDYVTLGSSKFQYQDNFTVSAFVKFSVIPNNAGGCGARHPIIYNHDYGYNLLIGTDGKVNWYIYNTVGSSKSVKSTSSVIGDSYVHVVGIKNGTTILLYVNGVLQGQDTLTSNAVYYTASQFVIGGYGMCGGTWFYSNGIIDDVRVYNRVLSSSEVARLYNLGK
ncbi:MAG: LamG domain-containing protein [Bacteroidota bacterium]